MLGLTNRELIVFMMRNYDESDKSRTSFRKIRKYFMDNRDEDISMYVLSNINKTAFRKIRRKLHK